MVGSFKYYNKFEGGGFKRSKKNELLNLFPKLNSLQRPWLCILLLRWDWDEMLKCFFMIK